MGRAKKTATTGVQPNWRDVAPEWVLRKLRNRENRPLAERPPATYGLTIERYRTNAEVRESALFKELVAHGMYVIPKKPLTTARRRA